MADPAARPRLPSRRHPSCDGRDEGRHGGAVSPSFDDRLDRCAEVGLGGADEASIQAGPGVELHGEDDVRNQGLEHWKKGAAIAHPAVHLACTVALAPTVGAGMTTRAHRCDGVADVAAHRTFLKLEPAV